MCVWGGGMCVYVRDREKERRREGKRGKDGRKRGRDGGK